MKMSSLLLTFCLLLVVSQSPAKAQDKTSAKDLALYSEIKSFSLTGGAVDVNGLVIKKDRAQITLAGTVYLAALANGQIIGAVFIGEGTFALETPPTDFEQANIRRLTGMDTIKTDFKTGRLQIHRRHSPTTRHPAFSTTQRACTEVGPGCRAEAA
jgi:hypothetical protein